MIPYGRQEITKEDILEVEKVLRSDFLTQGPVVPKFEQAVSKYCGANMLLLLIVQLVHCILLVLH
jgi:dTDP-4-amino-4,6-dideoxygalactose transaminase